MNVEHFARILGADFYAGVPDSQLRALCDYLTLTYGVDGRHHVIAANEGNAVGLAAGYHLATGRVPAVYLQNSGLGNIINPVASLLHEKVYGIPCLFIVGWRGEPGVHDEPQHIFQGEVTLRLLADMGIEAFVLSKDTTEDELADAVRAFGPLLSAGGQAAIVVRKGALTFDRKAEYANGNSLSREEAIRIIARAAGEDMIVSTTGKASRELYEIRVGSGGGAGHDFLTVGSMGHASSIALGISLWRPERGVWILDGDGAALMHMGALALIGTRAPRNLIHIVLNNAAHESVGGMPTAAGQIDLCGVARACGYPTANRVSDAAALQDFLHTVRERNELTFLEVACSIGSRADLGRPTTTPQENKAAFMKEIMKEMMQ